MDNLQRFYLARFEAAEEFGLHGNIEECLDICWDLRLEPDLAIYTRALVNSALARYAIPEENPEKMVFAKEVGVLAQYLRETTGANETVTWLEAHAAEVMEAFGKQMAEYEKAEREREAEREEMATENENDMQYVGGKWQRLRNGRSIPRRRPERPIVPFSIEGMYKPFGKPISHPSDDAEKPRESIGVNSDASDLKSTPAAPLQRGESVEMPIMSGGFRDQSGVPSLSTPERSGDAAATQPPREGSVSILDLPNDEDNEDKDEPSPLLETSSDRTDEDYDEN